MINNAPVFSIKKKCVFMKEITYIDDFDFKKDFEFVFGG
jgi:hypothetical protein